MAAASLRFATGHALPPMDQATRLTNVAGKTADGSIAGSTIWTSHRYSTSQVKSLIGTPIFLFDFSTLDIAGTVLLAQTTISNNAVENK